MTDQPLAILVTGMHASGSATLARLIALLSQRLTAPADGAERFPHVEHSSAVAALNRRILQEYGLDPYKPTLPFIRGKGVVDSASLIRESITGRFLDHAVGIIQSGTIGKRPMILEDPCLCLLHGLWCHALERSGLQSRIVLAVRNPLEVASALRAAQRMPASRVAQLWVQYNLAVLEAGPFVVRYLDLLDPGRGLAEVLCARFGWEPPAIAVPATGAAGQAAIALTEEAAQSRTDALSDSPLVSEWHAMVASSQQEERIAPQVLERSPLVPSLVKRLHAMLETWNAQQGATEATELASEFVDQSLFAGSIVQVKAPHEVKSAAPAVIAALGGPRAVLIHYHLFKNAGTSVDAILRRNFGDRWISTEFPPPRQADHQGLVRRLILDNPHLAAISSHTLMLPPPAIEGVEIFPIIFVRHPLDRMRSAYEFERKQEAATMGAKLAKEVDFAGYVRARLAIPSDRSCRNFQVFRLAMSVPSAEKSELDRALLALEQLPFVGLVEEFAASAKRLEGRVGRLLPAFHAFEAWENATDSRHRSIEARVGDICRELGDQCFAELETANRSDLTLYQKVCSIYTEKEDRALHE